MRAIWVMTAAALGACTMMKWVPAEKPEVPAITAFAQPILSPNAILAHVKVLASDEFEGRAPGTHGEQLSLDYIERAFTEAGLRPGVPGADGKAGWLQEVPMSSSFVEGDPVLAITGKDGNRDYQYRTQFVAWSKRVAPQVSIENAPLVFVGYGVVAPERRWNDYAGIDMHGKIAVILINDPDCETGDDRGFGGKAMTYYGRWTYKFEEAARQGAAGALIIHETAPAAYPWGVVQSSNTGSKFDIVREDKGSGRVAIEGWMATQVGQELFERAGLKFAEQKARAQTRGFKPVMMGKLRGSLALDLTVKNSRSFNVIGILPGKARPGEAIFYSAHWDHLGHCPQIKGDDICNGARDNASGVAGLIELARKFGNDAPADRTVAFMATTAEEQGLLGAQYYAGHPVYPVRDTVADINMDQLNISGAARDVTIVGMGKSDMDDLLAAAAAKAGRQASPDPFPEKGFFFRADQFEFARVGVPVLYVNAGIDLVNGGPTRGRALEDTFSAERYHRPQDEVTPDWDLTGASQDLHLLYDVGRGLAMNASWPEWRANAEFRDAREASRPPR
jgi:Zn-dependent M28 family amino/carboxypeptidase